MKKFLFFSVIGALLFCLAGFLFFAQQNLQNHYATAGASQNVSGWAFSETTGWISFNCSNCVSQAECSPRGACGIDPHKDYGVDIGSDGIISGYAWSEQAGWISFNQTELAGCPSGTCRAWVDLDNGQVYGWARALAPVGEAQAGSWDGWMRLRGADYGVYIDLTTIEKEFKGFAWGGGGTGFENATLGWISFNSLNCDSNNNGQSDKGAFSNCPAGQPVSRYFVKTSFSFPPRASNLTTNTINVCTLPSQYFSWLFSDPDLGDLQGAYQLQIDREGTFLEPFSAGELDTGKVSSGASERAVTIAKSPSLGQLGFNTPYRWRVKVWDNHDTASSWVLGPLFATPNHICPTPRFEWLPSYPSQGEVVQFCSTRTGLDCSVFTDEQVSRCYDSFNNPISCSGKTFLWTFPASAKFETGSSQSSENPEVSFDTPGPWDITLQITDPVVGACSITKTVRITLPLPQWQESSPSR